MPRISKVVHGATRRPPTIEWNPEYFVMETRGDDAVRQDLPGTVKTTVAERHDLLLGRHDLPPGPEDRTFAEQVHGQRPKSEPQGRQHGLGGSPNDEPFISDAKVAD